jgi:geranylgeranyl diphosphate synthase, type II
LSTIKIFQERINLEIEKFLQQNSGNPSELYDPINYTLRHGGKRMRPLLLLMGCDLFDGNIEDAIGPATGIEVFHNFTLLHDDIMDNAPLRRSEPTVHQKWGSNIAILSGDAMFVKACQQITKTREEHVVKVLNLFLETAVKVCEGQQFDMNFEKSSSITIDDYVEMISLKTAVLLAASLKMGAIIAGASEKDADNLYQFGKNIGIAFQLQDDILDVYGDNEKFGKRVGGDIVANKKTFLLLKAFELANKDQRVVLNKLLEGPVADEEKITLMTSLFNSLNIKEIASVETNAYYKKSMDCLGSIKTTGNNKKEQLASFAERLMIREI